MTSDTDRPPEVPAFRPVEPEPAPSFEPEPSLLVGPIGSEQGPTTVALSGARPATTRRTRLVVNGVLAAAFVVLVGGVAFAAGRATASVTAAGVDDAANGFLDGGVRPGDANGQAPIGPGGLGDDDLAGRFGPGLGVASLQGTVQSIDADSITIELADGSTIEIAIDSGTDYHRQAEASASDVSAGTTIVVGLDGLGLRDGSDATASDVTIVP